MVSAALVQPFIMEASEAVRTGKPVRPLVLDFCKLAGISTQAGYDQLKKHGVVLKTKDGKTRKSRIGKGISRIRKKDVLILAAFIEKSRSKIKTKREMPITVAVPTLIAEGAIADASIASYRRALERHYLDKKSRHEDEPYTLQRSLGPNHVWEADASQALWWYKTESGLKLNVERSDYEYKTWLRRDMTLKRYIVADHYTGCRWVYYVYAKGEDSASYVRLLWEAMTFKGDIPTLFGVPQLLYTDPGPGLKGAVLQNMLDAIGLPWQPHKPGNARATGLIESIHGWWEARVERKWAAQGFEPRSIEELNEKAFEECLIENTKRRSGAMTSWQLYKAELDESQLRFPPDWATCRRLATGAVIERQIDKAWMIRFKKDGTQYHYSLKHLRCAEIQPKLKVQFYPASDAGKDGHIWIDLPGGERHEVAPLIMNSAGKPMNAPVIGEEYKAAPYDLAASARAKALATELPAGKAQVVTPLKKQKEKQVNNVMLDRIDWARAYADNWDVELSEANNVFKRRYGEALTAPEIDTGEEENETQEANEA